MQRFGGSELFAGLSTLGYGRYNAGPSVWVYRELKLSPHALAGCVFVFHQSYRTVSVSLGIKAIFVVIHKAANHSMQATPVCAAGLFGRIRPGVPDVTVHLIGVE